MGIIESINKTKDKISDSGETYIRKTQEYYKLKIFQQLTFSISIVAKVLIFGGIFFSALIFMSFAAALALGEWLGDLALGYLILGSIFLLLGFLVYLKRDIINKKIIQSLSQKFFEGK